MSYGQIINIPSQVIWETIFYSQKLIKCDFDENAHGHITYTYRKTTNLRK